VFGKVISSYKKKENKITEREIEFPAFSNQFSSCANPISYPHNNTLKRQEEGGQHSID
jgi:hypothetical protein